MLGAGARCHVLGDGTRWWELGVRRQHWEPPMTPEGIGLCPAPCFHSISHHRCPELSNKLVPLLQAPSLW